MKKQTGAVVLAELLKSLGVTHIFMVPAVLRRTMVEIEKRTNIKRLHVHSEKSAAYMTMIVCRCQIVHLQNLRTKL